jgi:hypothetical protein
MDSKKIKSAVDKGKKSGMKNELKNNTAKLPQTIKNRCVKNKSLKNLVGFNIQILTSLSNKKNKFKKN